MFRIYALSFLVPIKEVFKQSKCYLKASVIYFVSEVKFKLLITIIIKSFYWLAWVTVLSVGQSQ
ncbi:hypothetical protein ATN88_07960 [Enterovibrio coralii]|uniref:Uncharacterized protein n=1 Tax=Enterovibrio coralii TaxID=294935 RepID=A0A135I576_9GAMM|nr:hypothetical protein ATN88_07960 [Enterovibrio coralii]